MVREPSAGGATLSTLYVDGMRFCDTLEDEDRHLETYPDRKQHGRTAIPRGTYSVTINWSNRFQRLLPEILNVPGFSGVRFHPGNTQHDTDGCILPGRRVHGAVPFVGNSRVVFEKLFALMRGAVKRGESITLEVV